MPSTNRPEFPMKADDPSRSLRAPRMRAFYELTKPGIAGFVMMTTGVCYFVGSQGRPEWVPLALTLLGTVLATGGALALNQYLERRVDSQMQRTLSRPLPSGRLVPQEALGFGLLLVALGCGLLAATVGHLPAGLTLLSAVAYNLVYTPLKSRSYLATFAGAIPGAMPALIGWSAATGEVTLGALVLFGIAFLWQVPHVLALAWLLREDYQKAGFLLAPPSDPEGKQIGRQMVFYSFILIPASATPTLLSLTGLLYLGGALVLGVLLLLGCWQASRSMSQVLVRRVFLASLAYQPLLLGLMVVDTVRS